MSNLTELLMKARKGATAAFGAKEWQAVLGAVGVRMTLEKTGRTVTKAILTVFDGVRGIQHQHLIIEKESFNRRITFYEIPRFLKNSNLDLVAATSKVLGLETPEAERKLKELYVRDLTNTGTCPVCEGNFKRNGTGLVHHGFDRPGDGAIHGDCFAVGYLPWELSPIGAQEYLALALRPHRASMQAYLADLQGGLITRFFKKVTVREPGMKYTTTVELTSETNNQEFQDRLESEIRDTERSIQWSDREIERFSRKIEAWKPDDLPEVKHAGKFKKA